MDPPEHLIDQFGLRHPMAIPLQDSTGGPPLGQMGETTQVNQPTTPDLADDIKPPDSTQDLKDDIRNILLNTGTQLQESIKTHFL